MSAKSTGRTASSKAARKPSKDFPLYAHRAGYWAKKVRGQTRYFGKVADDPQGKAALELWLEQRDDLLAGREPRANREGLTVADLCNEYLTRKEQLRNTGEISPRTYRDYYRQCVVITKSFGKSRVVSDLQPSDFAKLRTTLAKTRGMAALRNWMQGVRSVFKFAFDDGLIDAPIRFGQSFAKPRPEAIDRERKAYRAAHGLRMFEADELRRIIDAAGPAMRVMVLLGVNCAFGQSDVSSLPIRAVDLDGGWLDFPRPKTGVDRRIPLWPETREAIRDWLPARPKPSNAADAGLVFLTRFGTRWVGATKPADDTKIGGGAKDGVGKEFNRLLIKLGLKRPRVSFYALRHTFETIAGETADQIAVAAVMGHKARDMGAHYRERIGDNRLRRVVEHVRAWLWPELAEPPADDKPAEQQPKRSNRAVKSKAETVNERMAAMLQADPSCLAWSARKWAAALACTAAAVKQTATWKTTIRNARAMQQADRATRRR